MIRSLRSAATGMNAQQLNLDNISNNLANVNTTAFKEEKTFFTLLDQAMNSEDTNELEAALRGQEVLSRGAVNLGDGPLLATNRELDLALTGSGYFVVETPRGIRYTRNGSLFIGNGAVLTTADGFPVLGERGRITVGPGKLTVNGQGEVFLNGSRIDRLKFVTFQNPGGLLREGSSLLAPEDGQKEIAAASMEVRQGYLEQSNVNAIASVVGMVAILRQFEAIQKSVSVLMNDVDAKAIERLSR